MPNFIQSYVRTIDRVNHILGRATMFLIFAMGGVLFYSAFTKAFLNPSLWTFEAAQFLMMAYFLVGGAYSIQLRGHVRMDLLYSRLSSQGKNRWDAFTSFFMIAYLLLLLYGALSSTFYAFEYGERSYTPWRPYMWPIKTVMVFGIVMMLLQAFSEFFKDLASALGKSLP